MTNASLTMLHSPASTTATGVSRHDDNPCEENEKEGARDPRIRRGFEIAPVVLNLEGRDCGLVGLGSYLVNAAGGMQ